MIMSYNSFVYDLSEELKPEGNIEAECVAYFTPDKSFSGEFGFDWFRTGETGIKGDSHFKDIIGRHYSFDTITKKKKTSGNYRNPFESLPELYKKKRNSFSKFIISWKKKLTKLNDDNCDYTYYVPRMTLMKDKSAKLCVEVEINPKGKKPNEIKLQFENEKSLDFLSLNVNNLPIKNGKSSVIITCKNEFSTVQILNVYADNNICGKLKILPNSKEFQRSINVVFVNVATNLVKDDEPHTGKPYSGSKELFEKTLNQALITVSKGISNVTLDCTERKFCENFCKNIGNEAFPNYVIDMNKADSMKKYLTEQMNKKFDQQYSEYYQVFFFQEYCVDANGIGINGYAYLNSLYGVYFASHNAATVGHEMFHALGLMHTFDYTDTRLSDYAYQYAKTDNMLDYSHHVGIKRQSLFYWQWKKLNSRVK